MRIIRRTTAESQQRRHGAALVEAAVVLPVLLIIVLGIIEFGRAMMVVQLMTNGAREGARRAILDGSTNALVEGHVRTILSSSIGCDPDDLTVGLTLTPDPDNTTVGNEVGNAQPGDLVNVAVAISYDRVAYLSAGFLTGKIIRAKNTMRHE